MVGWFSSWSDVTDCTPTTANDLKLTPSLLYILWWSPWKFFFSESSRLLTWQGTVYLSWDGYLWVPLPPRFSIYPSIFVISLPYQIKGSVGSLLRALHMQGPCLEVYYVAGASGCRNGDWPSVLPLFSLSLSFHKCLHVIFPWLRLRKHTSSPWMGCVVCQLKLTDNHLEENNLNYFNCFRLRIATS